ncbi:membrane-bound lytic murein transglycosylase D [Luteibacter sp. UNCMF331Sha3.1]|uniref:transglycosylase SLT domain-containing protein n=1 Tax=Luteibacter sp. UNCMF331Sha3.1 TaxID=1502760 RepID=UPI0008D7B610|nr:transglycosylase SLT domain-containing protein [Luteibacter sp. UNCMF331Sha3.1]SEN01179.1 membrane-bound lytic murein transglycosylase D [Luteibacter sp. UNCMF331Sha3.1]
MNRLARRLLPTIIPLLLTACAGGTPKALPHPLPTVTAAPAVEDVTVTPKMMRPTQAADFWSGMRDSFAMQGCEADPQVLAWARTYTKMPNRFEQQINEVLPLIVYAHKSAMKHSVAGEFALLPWVESQYRHVPGQKNRPAGMWQIMPQTARTLGLRVEKNYDERLDITKSTESVMSMMRRYYDDLGDWRLVDVAYNAGEFGLKKTIDRHGGPSDDGGLPDVPMKANTKEHLVKLMAIACIVRDPARFNVSLPRQDGDDALQLVKVSSPQSLAQAAKQSGLSVNDLRDFNPAFRTEKATISANLLLPKSAADQYRLGPVDPVADTSDPLIENDVADEPAPLARASRKSPKAGKSAAVAKSKPKASAKPGSKDDVQLVVHKVNDGESLWSIARRHQVSVQQLMKWNDLQTQAVKPGQVLKLTASR